MPIHDWTRVEPVIFRSFHIGWIAALGDALNRGLLPPDCYAMIAVPRVSFTGRTGTAFERRNTSAVAIHRTSGDQVVAYIEIMTPEITATSSTVPALAGNAHELLTRGINLLIIDLFASGGENHGGIHGGIWKAIANEEFQLPRDSPLTLVSYESGTTLNAYLEPVAVGGKLPDMPLFLGPQRYVNIPLNATYQTAFGAMPARWRKVLEF